MEVRWLEQTEADVPEGSEWLSAPEAARLNGMRFIKRRTDWRLGRWTAKRATAGYLNLADPGALAGIEIRPAPSGAPEVFLADQPAPVAISLSHCGGTAVCAIAPSGTALGCDLERIEPRSAAFVADYFSSWEQELVSRAPAADRPRLTTLIWSAKESALKALRVGLRVDTRSVIVDLADTTRQPGRNGWFPLDVRNTGGGHFHGWWQDASYLMRTMVSDPQARPPRRISRSPQAPRILREER